MADDRSIPPPPVDFRGAAAFAAAISDGLKVREVVVGFLAIGMAATDQMRAAAKCCSRK
jgi:hypothetical protein